MLASLAYEIEPIKKASVPIIGVPDADRIWASSGFVCKVTQNATTDLHNLMHSRIVSATGG